MAIVVERLCVKDFSHPELSKEENPLLKRGKEYTTLEKTKEGLIRVFTRYWFWIEQEYFVD